MQAIVIETHGTADVLKIKEVDLSAPGAGEVAIDVAVAGVNFMDVGTREGYKGGKTDLPMTPGVEGAGTITAIGEGVTAFKVGDRVAWYFIWGSYSERVIAPVESLVPIPDDIDFETAASLMMQGLTASNLVFEAYPVKPGDVALVHAAAGGVGLLLTQMIKALGGSVIGRVSSEDKVELARKAGAGAVIVDRTGSFADAALAANGGNGFNVVYDGTGAESFADSIRCVGIHGTLAIFGPLMDSVAPIDPFSLPNSMKLTYPIVMHHVLTHDVLIQRSMQLFAWVREGKLSVHIGGRYPLSQAAQAHRDIQSRRTAGKLLLIPGA